MFLVGANKGFEIFFDCARQRYTVNKDGKFLINGFKFSEVKCYII
jgi:hypothetical protein